MSGIALTPLRGGPLVTATVGIAVLTAMTVLDSTIANVALSTIAGNLGVAVSQGTWVITFFGVANAVAIPLTGWLARRLVRGAALLCRQRAVRAFFLLMRHFQQPRHC